MIRRNEMALPISEAITTPTAVTRKRPGDSSSGTVSGITWASAEGEHAPCHEGAERDQHGLQREPGRERPRRGADGLEDAQQPDPFDREQREEQGDDDPGDRERRADDGGEHAFLLAHARDAGDRLVDRERRDRRHRGVDVVRDLRDRDPSSGVTRIAWNVPGATAASGMLAFNAVRHVSGSTHRPLCRL